MRLSDYLIRPICTSTEPSGQYNLQLEAYKMAVKLMNGMAQPTVCDIDAVSREAVINTLDNIDKALDEDRTVENYKALLKECYEVLPSVTLQRKSNADEKHVENTLDAVSRDAVIGKVKELFSMGECYCDEHSIIGMINELPSVTRQTGEWIPVSKRLPEENKQVLIQYRTRYRDDVNIFDVTSRTDYNYWQGIGREIEVIAWMPLPEPYKAESEDKG